MTLVPHRTARLDKPNSRQHGVGALPGQSQSSHWWASEPTNGSPQVPLLDPHTAVLAHVPERARCFSRPPAPVHGPANLAPRNLVCQLFQPTVWMSRNCVSNRLYTMINVYIPRD